MEPSLQADLRLLPSYQPYNSRPAQYTNWALTSVLLGLQNPTHPIP